jgi:hypothetical protein
MHSELYPSIVAGRMAVMMIQKRRKRSRSSSDVLRNEFPIRSVRRRKQEGVEDALVE